jgi:hypothetical protein
MERRYGEEQAGEIKTSRGGVVVSARVRAIVHEPRCANSGMDNGWKIEIEI